MSRANSSNGDLTSRLATLLLQRHDGKALLQGISFEHLAHQVDTPFYVYDENVMLRQLQLLRRTLPEQVEIYYSVKANPHVRVIESFVGQGCGCEIASGGEYVLAKRAGAHAGRIVFSGPGKGEDELTFVISQGIGEVHVESFEEIETIERIGDSLSKSVAVSLRINPGAGSGAGLLMGGQATAFGFEEESLAKVLVAIRGCGRLNLSGIHLYVGTQILDADSLLSHWKHAVQLAAQVSDLSHKPVSTIDFGGGLGIPYFAHEKELDLNAVRQGATEILEEATRDSRLADSQFIVEPGRFLVGPAGIYVASVRSVKQCRGDTFVVLDGGMNHHLAASGNLGQVLRRDYPIVNLSRNHGPSDEPVTLVGPLCTPIDTLGRRVTLPRPKPGDLIGILQSGAYGLTASPARFLSHPTPAEVMLRDGDCEVITPRGEPFRKVHPVTGNGTGDPGARFEKEVH
ncbi:MAG TPA: type III PLP-dependent enzyme [Terriglobales bacterium]|nr:type III PLP-dependent enzyme [Terriglobales bacterium]